MTVAAPPRLRGPASPAASRGHDRRRARVLRRRRRLPRRHVPRAPDQRDRGRFHAHDARLDDWSEAAVRARAATARRHRAALAAFDRASLGPSARIDRGLLLNDIDATLFLAARAQAARARPQFPRRPARQRHPLPDAPRRGLPAWPSASRRSSAGWAPSRLPGRRPGCPARAAARRHRDDPQDQRRQPALLRGGPAAPFRPRPVPGRRPPVRQRPRHRRPPGVPGLGAGRPPAALRPAPGPSAAISGAASSASRCSRRWTPTPSPAAPARRSRRSRPHAEVAEPLHHRLFPGHHHGGTADARLSAIVGEVVDAVSARHPTRATLFEYVRRRRRADQGLHPAGRPRHPAPGRRQLRLEADARLPRRHGGGLLQPPAHPRAASQEVVLDLVAAARAPPRRPRLEESFLREYNDYALQGLAIHEAFPGHYVQYWHALRSPFATVYKKVFSSGTFAEGWAVLAENLMFESGLCRGEPENLLIHLKHGLRAPMNALLDARPARLRRAEADLDHWALDLMQRTGFQEEAEARGKLRRAKVTSTQLSTYFVGLVEMADIVEDAAAPRARLPSAPLQRPPAVLRHHPAAGRAGDDAGRASPIAPPPGAAAAPAPRRDALRRALRRRYSAGTHPRVPELARPRKGRTMSGESSIRSRRMPPRRHRPVRDPGR